MTQKIIIVEQDKDVAELLEASFKSVGFSAVAKTSVTDALTEVKRDKSDLLILDLQLPSQGALEIVQKILELEKGDSLPVLALGTERGEGSSVREVVQSHFSSSDFIKKPFRIPQLLHLSLNLLQESQSQTEAPAPAKPVPDQKRSVPSSRPVQDKTTPPDVDSDFIDLIEPDQGERSSASEKTVRLMEMETMEMEAVSEDQITPAKEPARPPTGKKHIVVVDDEVMILNLLKKMLSEVGFEVTTTHKATEALKIITQTAPELVISDIMMPQLDGYSLCRMIKSKKELANTKVMLLTAKNLSQDQGKGFKSGADFFMQKPINRVKLLSVVKNLLNL